MRRGIGRRAKPFSLADRDGRIVAVAQFPVCGYSHPRRRKYNTIPKAAALIAIKMTG